MANKHLVLNGVEEKTLKATGNVEVVRNGVSYEVSGTNGDYVINVVTNGIQVIMPSELKETIILTYNQCKELKQTGNTTYIKGGKTYLVSMDLETGEISVNIDNPYMDVILKSEC